MKISTKQVYWYMAIFLNFSPTSNHLHLLQVENSRLVVDEDDYGKFRIERVNPNAAEFISTFFSFKMTKNVFIYEKKTYSKLS